MSKKSVPFSQYTHYMNMNKTSSTYSTLLNFNRHGYGQPNCLGKIAGNDEQNKS